jgi:TRAP-type mannitol/chloroaromatic compound transport system permease small subunit
VGARWGSGGGNEKEMPKWLFWTMVVLMFALVVLVGFNAYKQGTLGTPH